MRLNEKGVYVNEYYKDETTMLADPNPVKDHHVCGTDAASRCSTRTLDFSTMYNSVNFVDSNI